MGRRDRSDTDGPLAAVGTYLGLCLDASAQSSLAVACHAQGKQPKSAGQEQRMSGQDSLGVALRGRGSPVCSPHLSGRQGQDVVGLLGEEGTAP